MSERAQIEDGLKHLRSSSDVVGQIVAYCISAHKADPSAETTAQIRRYVADTANSVCSHVLNISRNIQLIIEKESNEIQDLAHQMSFAQHRLMSHQSYMSQLYMTKFQTLPRPKHNMTVLRETVPTDQLPKHSKPHKSWKRSGTFDYSVLDHVGMSTLSPEDRLKLSRKNEVSNPQGPVNAPNPSRSLSHNAPRPSFSPKPAHKSLYQQERASRVAPPSFSSFAPAPNFSSTEVVASKPPMPPRPPAPPKPPQAALIPPLPPKPPQSK